MLSLGIGSETCGNSLSDVGSLWTYQLQRINDTFEWEVRFKAGTGVTDGGPSGRPSTLCTEEYLDGWMP